jgi:mycothiol synthase
VDDIARTLEEGGWLPVNGRTFAPLLRPGDEIRVVPCGEAELRRGDLALLADRGAYSVGVVVSRAPLVARPIRGREPACGAVRGRVAAVRRDGRERAFGARMRAFAWALQRASYAGGAMVHAGAHLVRASAPGRALRGRARAVTLRRLTSTDAAVVDAYAAENLAGARNLIARQIRGRWNASGIALGAFDRAGRMCGFVFLDTYRAEGVALDGEWIRNLSVGPAARELGTGLALVHRACDEAAKSGIAMVYADVRSDNVPSLRLFRRAGFADAGSALTAEANARLREPGAVPRVIFVRHLPPSAAPAPVCRADRDASPELPLPTTSSPDARR